MSVLLGMVLGLLLASALGWKLVVQPLKEKVKVLQKVIELDSAQKMERVLRLESALRLEKKKASELELELKFAKARVLALESDFARAQEKWLWKE